MEVKETQLFISKRLFLFGYKIYKCILQEKLQLPYGMYETIFYSRHIAPNQPFTLSPLIAHSSIRLYSVVILDVLLNLQISGRGTNYGIVFYL